MWIELLCNVRKQTSLARGLKMRSPPRRWAHDSQNLLCLADARWSSSAQLHYRCRLPMQCLKKSPRRPGKVSSHDFSHRIPVRGRLAHHPDLKVSVGGGRCEEGAHLSPKLPGQLGQVTIMPAETARTKDELKRGCDCDTGTGVGPQGGAAWRRVLRKLSRSPLRLDEIDVLRASLTYSSELPSDLGLEASGRAV